MLLVVSYQNGWMVIAMFILIQCNLVTSQLSETQSQSQPDIDLRTGQDNESQPKIEAKRDADIAEANECEYYQEETSLVGKADEESAKTDSENENKERSILAQWLVLFSLIMVLSIVGNILILTVLLKNKKTRTKQANVFFISLIIARTTVAVFVIPGRITSFSSDLRMEKILCKLCQYVGDGSVAVGVISTVASIVGKYMEIMRKKTLSLRSSLMLLIVVWVAGFLWAIRSLVFTDLYLLDTSSGQVWICITNPDDDRLHTFLIFIDFMCLFLSPSMIGFIIYWFAASTIQQRKKRGALRHLPQNSMDTLRMFAADITLFNICHIIPYMFRMYLYVTDTKEFQGDLTEIWRGIYWVSYANSWLNIFAYVYFRRDILGGIIGLFCKGKGDRFLYDGSIARQPSSPHISTSISSATLNARCWENTFYSSDSIYDDNSSVESLCRPPQERSTNLNSNYMQSDIQVGRPKHSVMELLSLGSNVEVIRKHSELSVYNLK